MLGEGKWKSNLLILTAGLTLFYANSDELNVSSLNAKEIMNGSCIRD